MSGLSAATPDDAGRWRGCKDGKEEDQDWRRSLKRTRVESGALELTVSITPRVQYDLMRVSESVRYAARLLGGKSREAGELL